MGCTVFANDSGFFHKGSGGSGKAFPDVCLSPPPSPTGPVPVPYPNSLKASDLAKGSKTVKIQKKPTALENKSNVKTSMGDEAGNQGGNVLTHKTKGKGYFMLWSFDVKVEGKGVCRHGDPMGQNCTSTPPGGLDARAKVVAAKALKAKEPCDRPYNKKDRHGSPTEKQKDAVNKPNAKCWECKSPSPTGWLHPPRKRPPPPTKGVARANPKKKRFVADHQPPVLVNYYAGGCHKSEDEQKKIAKDPKKVKPHCSKCSSRQGGLMSGFSSKLKAAHGL
ncbi:MAG: DUF4150 domain-containing protein [Planctomycetota bacterium]